jgi:PHD/YefM family antitoxin component YafN of YafNO toxin-antitoxin module
MVTYGRNEIISASEMARGFSNVLNQIVDHTSERFAIAKNNKLEAVIVNIEEYERLKEAYELLEHIELATTIEKRKASKTVALEDVMKHHEVTLDEL